MFGVPAYAVPFVYFGVTIGLTALFAYVASVAIRGLMRQSKPQVMEGARTLGVALVWLVGVVIAVQGLGVSVDILLLVVALLGIATIIALRQPLENFGAKYIADVYSPFQIGDTIRVGEQTGKVIEMNAMSTVLLTEDDRLVSLPNSLLLRQSVANLTPQAWKQLVVPITLAGSIDLAAFESDLLKTLAKIRIRLDPRYPPVFSTKARSTQSTDLVLTVMVRRPEDRDPVLTEVNLRLAAVLQKARAGGSRATPPADAGTARP